ncbi:hypothetical protein AB0J83_03365 [Actinoplanes sp. NPDC049596]|uniref:hypothetical protein n=1 Tax=unclassified Actinoplanes TaxID=2626549 RepID=UPI003449053B
MAIILMILGTPDCRAQCPGEIGWAGAPRLLHMELLGAAEDPVCLPLNLSCPLGAGGGALRGDSVFSRLHRLGSRGNLAEMINAGQVGVLFDATGQIVEPARQRFGDVLPGTRACVAVSSVARIQGARPVAL